MVALNFSMFIDKVENGTKPHTIRARRKRPVNVGNKLDLFTGMRTRYCRRLKVQPGCKDREDCIRAQDIEIVRPGSSVIDIFVDGVRLKFHQMNQLALRDGFANWGEFIQYFMPPGRERFDGQIIWWKEA